MFLTSFSYVCELSEIFFKYLEEASMSLYDDDTTSSFSFPNNDFKIAHY